MLDPTDQPRRIEYLPLTELKRAPRNPKAHLIGEIGSSITRFGYVEPIVIDERTGSLVAGHGRLETLQRMRASEATPPKGILVGEDGEWLAPVMRGWASKSDADAEAYLLASNQLTIAGGWDEDALKDMLGDLASADLAAGLGWSPSELEKLLATTDTTLYTDKISSPIYKPTGPKPKTSELCDRQKHDALVAEIDSTDGVTEDERAFLLVAAQRHVVFDYQQIAEYYAHASAPMQRLMERSALVIIDFNQAIENGFVKLTEGLAEELEAQEQSA